MDYRRTYRSAAIVFADLVARIPPDALDGPGLGEWTLRDLLGHTVSSALRQVPAVLATPAPTVLVPAPEAYFALARVAPADLVAAAHKASDEDARATGAALGDDPAGVVSGYIGQATAALAGAGDDDLVVTAAGGMRVEDWLPTRTFELVVHTSDAAVAAGLPIAFDPDTLATTAALAARIAAAIGHGIPTIRALTGRAPLPATFSVL
ncbi:maleylpyruvate isomerase N-terminal domain-containing protein [Actinoplanes sp. NPDC026670]|uniref:maleylpyruvate isomerase N-terminal domain-containing protein n=1 Tax=Actinoplanes sp. NPDC026670 TaxID=3154700 RepID=UPI0033EEB418